ncbi:class I SAM-dependent methyltransferase [Salinibacter sp.]|uniref:class I SAM-dependent methyltransferase n=1 Tax=Salinibacter sp. TaxID=2065818 RepID=UPI0021E72261|nr:class I SAM-dependent methyltransferase [Salinibacter sp.]
MSHSHDRTPRQDPAVPAQYDAWATVYDLFWARYVNKTIPVLQRVADVTAGERGLDLACGTGPFEWRVLDEEPDATLVGVDLSPAMVERARAKLDGRPGVRFEQADVHDLPFGDNAFDVAVCANTFHYFTHPEQVLTEARRVLRPGGRLVVLDWCRDVWTCRVMDAVLPHLDPAYQYCYTLDEMRALLAEADFSTHRQFRYRFDLIWGMMVVEAVPNRS